MTLRYCRPDVTIVSHREWQPTEAFDCSWAGAFGCSQLECRNCKELVRSFVVDEIPKFRRYECACQRLERSYATHTLRSEPDWADQRIESDWYCAGHPQITLPMELDGVRLEEGNWPAIVAQTLATPPFVAPGVGERTKSFWVQRLYHLLWTQEQRAQVSQAVAKQLYSENPQLVSAALDFFYDEPRVADSIHVIEVACDAKDRLQAMQNPKYPARTLYARALEVANFLMLKPLPGEAATDLPALELVRSALLNGETHGTMMYGIARRDPDWFAAHAADIVRANAADVTVASDVGYALKKYAPDSSSKFLEDLENFGPELHAAVVEARKHFGL